MTGILKGALTGIAVFAAGFALLAVILPPEVRGPEPEPPAALVAAPVPDRGGSLAAAGSGLPDASAPEQVALVPAPEAAEAPLVEVADPSPQRVAEPGNPPSPPGQTPPTAVDDTVRLGPPGVGNAPPPPEARAPAMTPQPLADAPPAAPSAEAPPDPAPPPADTATVAEAPAPETAPDPAPGTAPLPTPTRRLPQVGVEPAPETAAAPPVAEAPAPETAPETAPDPAPIPTPTRRLPQVGVEPAPAAAPVTAAEPPAWQRFRAAGAEGGARPPLGLVLLDPARALETEAALVGFPVPVTVALDPFDPDAPRRAQVYRATGHEVVLAIDGIAPGATASDLEVLLEAWAHDFPEALGLIELPPGEGRRSRALAPVVIPALQARGLALVAPDRGLSPMLAAGRAAGLPLAGLYRALDAADEDEGTIRRQLDRAAFEAERLGRIAVFARADRAVTRTAITAWLAGGGRAQRVAAGPAGPVLAVP